MLSEDADSENTTGNILEQSANEVHNLALESKQENPKNMQEIENDINKNEERKKNDVEEVENVTDEQCDVEDEKCESSNPKKEEPLTNQMKNDFEDEKCELNNSKKEEPLTNKMKKDVQDQKVDIVAEDREEVEHREVVDEQCNDENGGSYANTTKNEEHLTNQISDERPSQDKNNTTHPSENQKTETQETLKDLEGLFSNFENSLTSFLKDRISKNDTVIKDSYLYEINLLKQQRTSDQNIHTKEKELLQKENDLLAGENSDLKIQNAALKKELHQSRQGYQQLSQKSEDQVEKYEKQMSETNKLISHLQSLVKSNQDRAEELATRNNNMMDEIIELKMTISGLSDPRSFSQHEDKNPQQITENPKVKINFKNRDHTFSNLYMCQIKIFSQTFTSSEAAYQYRKAIFHDDFNTADNILRAPSSEYAMKGGKEIKTNKLWDEHRDEFMERILRAKAEQVPKFQSTLLDSGDAILLEDTTDTHWAKGIPGEEGEQVLGKLLMKIRKDLQNSINRSTPEKNESKPEPTSNSKPAIRN